MKLSRVKSVLKSLETINFILEDGTRVPEHFHVTEIGLITKNFIDCGGTIRKETVINFQLWDANDFDHQLKPQKLINIIELSEKVLGIEDLEIEVEYQTQTIGKYDLDFNGNSFVLQYKKTACLAQDQCGIPATKNEIVKETSCYSPGAGCC